MPISIKQLLQNPSGKYSTYFGRRSDIIANMETRFGKMMQEKKKFECEIYKKDNDYYYVMKVPSETYPDFWFDVVVQVTPSAEGFVTDYTINNYDVKLFSNSPNFVFTYAYVYDKTGTMVDFLRDKIEERALEEEPKVRNPIQSYGYEKSVYFALLWIKQMKLDVKSNIKSDKFDAKKISKEVSDSSAVLKKYNIMQKRITEEKRKKKELEKKKEDKKPIVRKVKLTRKRDKK